MSDDTTSSRERAPGFDVDDEQMAARRAFIDRGYPLVRAKALARDSVSYVSADANGDPVWATSRGAVGGSIGRQAVVQELHQREQKALEQLVERRRATGTYTRP